MRQRERMQFVKRLLLSLLLYAVSLALVAMTLHGRVDEHVRGWQVLELGWMGLLILQPAWLANVAYVMTFTTWKTFGRSRFYAISACLLAAGSFLSKKFPLDDGNHLVTWRAGSIVWAGAMIVLMVARAMRPNSSLQRIPETSTEGEFVGQSHGGHDP